MTTNERNTLPEPARGGPVTRFLRLIRFSHTLFALPFALGALIVAAGGIPPPRVLLLVLVCMVCARTAAMLFNRWVDWALDQRNPRTASRHLLLSRSAILICLLLASGGFVAGAAFLNDLTLKLSPVALILIFFYSVTKRFTVFTHFFLGLALAIVPMGAWIAQTGALSVPPIVLAASVLCWVTGFDLIYAIQDYEFDRREGLRSLVVRLGVSRSLKVAQLLHLVTLIGLIGFGWTANLGTPYYLAMLLIAGALVYEHRSAGRLSIGDINRAFFQSNAFVSLVFLVAVCLDRIA